ncbi:hypothetical protein K8W59_15135 [Nocardioides rotundus]|uniref:hypothetical protein n=1 Tax=Nocardioides rotundus TaxID=1774216 RepID=UPI001CC15004|nr:hypothetical protein [Nocardioides rotundus]UAL29114.1 hypothetical protein K8W59_15135 [Nocardioides rotundus]
MSADYGTVQESREAVDRLLGMQVVEGRVDADEADLLAEAISRLCETWACYALALAEEM